MAIKSPRCELCSNVEFRNVVNFGYLVEDKVNHHRVKMCIDCEKTRVRKVAEDKYKRPIYVKV